MLRTEAETAPAARGGIVGGLAGGVVLWIVLLVLAAMNDESGWAIVKMAGAPLLHSRALSPGFDWFAVVVGTAAHFSVAIAWGFGFASVAYGLSRSSTLLLGVLWGIVTWAGMYYVVLPIVGLGALAHHTPTMMTIGVHVVFGVAVALGFMPFQEVRIRVLRPA